MISTTITGTAHYEANPRGIDPFTVGDLDPDKGYVHVLDDTTLDTITDFVQYLTKKETFMRGGRAVMAVGEEDLLAYYLSHVDENEEHAFVIPHDINAVYVDEGRWEDFKRSPQRQAQLKANEVSYAWDALVEQFANHTICGTQYFRSHEGINHNERTIRWLAREPRTRRRALVTALFELMDEDVPEWSRRTRVLLSSRPGDPYYVLMISPRPQGVAYEKYRTGRRNMLEACCRVLKAMRPEARDIIGVATEQGSVEERSEDAVYLDAREWSEEDQAQALNLQEEWDILNDVSGYATRVQEYPEPPAGFLVSPPSGAVRMKGRNRNSPCPCGSGRKFKKCCGST